jgi:hypothetical protein
LTPIRDIRRTTYSITLSARTYGRHVEAERLGGSKIDDHSNLVEHARRPPGRMHRLRVCVAECPVDAIKPDTEPGLEKWLSLYAEYAKIWPNITVRKAPPDSKEWEGKPDKSVHPLSQFSRAGLIVRKATQREDNDHRILRSSISLPLAQTVSHSAKLQGRAGIADRKGAHMAGTRRREACEGVRGLSLRSRLRRQSSSRYVSC